MKKRNHIALVALAGLFLVSAAGCHSLPKHTMLGKNAPCDASCDADILGDCCDNECDDACDCDPAMCDSSCDAMGFSSKQLVRGKRIKWLDDTGSILGFANKIALWDKRADNHVVSPATERAVLQYLRRNNLNTTLVRSNQYDPIGEWGRLVANKRMAAPWKYTFGTYDWLKYTLIPGRVLGGDWYNPFTDSIHLYSDIPSIGLAKAAYAKDVHGRTYPGTYASAQDTPLLGLWHETLANQEVMRYTKANGNEVQVAEARRILYPDFGGAVGQQVLGFLPYGSVYGRAAGALAGHAVRGVTNPGGGSQPSGIPQTDDDVMVAKGAKSSVKR